MANKDHLIILKQGVEIWNRWRVENPKVTPDLAGTNLMSARLSSANLAEADLRGADLRNADLSNADLSKANLESARLAVAKLRGANLVGANLSKAFLFLADLSHTTLIDADLSDANLDSANLTGADLAGANLFSAELVRTKLIGATLVGTSLEGATLIETELSEATLIDCDVYGISAWGLKLADIKKASNLRITPEGESAITVDNLEVAQFVYLLLHNEKIRSVIDTIGEKGVLILGRFTEERKAVLDAIRSRLRELGFVPMMFDFEKPTQRDFTETVRMLAGMSRFIIADITNPKSSPLELQAIMPDYMIPFVPIIHENDEPFAMFRDLKQKYGEWVLDILTYDSADSLLKVLDKAVVRPALEKADQLSLKKAEATRKRHVKDYM
jgi:uncharacterized protein YjbI with pentapeptide repeats